MKKLSIAADLLMFIAVSILTAACIIAIRFNNLNGLNF